MPFVTEYRPSVPSLKNILMSKWHLIENQPLLREIYKDPPLLSYRKGRSLENVLVRAKLWRSKFFILTNRSRVWPVNYLNHHRLDELIHGSETAKRTLRAKDEGILIDGQKKRKSTKKKRLKALVNEDTLLQTHCCPWCFLGCANWETFVADTECFCTKAETFFVPRTQNLCPQQMLRARANGETFVSAKMCPQEFVLVCQGLKTVSKSRKNRLDMCANIPRCCSASAITREKTIKLWRWDRIKCP